MSQTSTTITNNCQCLQQRSWMRFMFFIFVTMGTLFLLTFYNEVGDWMPKSLPIDYFRKKLSSKRSTINNEVLVENKKHQTINDGLLIYNENSFFNESETDILEVSQNKTRLTNIRLNIPSIYPSPIVTSDKTEFLVPLHKTGFLVFSDKCQIPDVDPYHSTVRGLIKISPPLDCGVGYPPLSYTEGNTLRINQSWVSFHSKNKDQNLVNNNVTLKCCIQELTRAKDGKTDDAIQFSKTCKEVFDVENITSEFVRIDCSLNGSRIYRNYHSFVHDKPKTELRSLEYLSKESPIERPDRYSVLILGADAMSRLNSLRQLKKTLKYLKESMEAIEMKGFNKVGDNTFPNLIPLLTGLTETELNTNCRGGGHREMDNCTLIWSEFANHGYRTFYAEDTPHISTFNYIKKGFLKQPTDYYFRPMMLPLEDDLGRDKRLNCHLCVGSVSEAEAVLEYAQKFVKNFRKRPFFAMAWINSMSHDFLNSASAGDHFFAKFFQSLHNDSYLDDTFVIMMGDHGQRWGEIRSTHIGKLEENLPMMVIAPPKTFKTRYPKLYENIVANSHRLITPFDLFALLENILYFTGKSKQVNTENVPSDIKKLFSKRAISLLSPIPQNRDCEDAAIAESWCSCHKSNPIPIDNEEVKHVTKFTISKLNEKFKNYSGCANLKLDKIIKANLRTPKKSFITNNKDSNIYDYTVEFQTLPGGAVFESTVRFVPYKHEHSILGEVSRLNLYGTQSSCVYDATLKKYCYCKRESSFT